MTIRSKPGSLREMKRRVIFFLVLCAAVADAGAGFPQLLGNFEYASARLRLGVNLWEDGRCLLTTRSANAPSTSYFECHFTIKDDVIVLDWTLGTQKNPFLPVRLYYDALADSLVADGEPNHVLVRRKDKTWSSLY
jgi:hypothetical protein